MKSLGVALLFAMAAVRGDAQERCDFDLRPSASEPSIIASEPVSSRVRVLEQPGSPVEIVAADLSGLVLTLTDDGYSYHSEALGSVEVRNRTDQQIQYVIVSLRVGSCRQIAFGGSVGRPRRVALPPGGTVRIETPFGSGGGITTDANPTEVFMWISRVELRNCIYQPAVTTSCALDQ
jgi:hypothetical protein